MKEAINPALIPPYAYAGLNFINPDVWVLKQDAKIAANEIYNEARLTHKAVFNADLESQKIELRRFKETAAVRAKEALKGFSASIYLANARKLAAAFGYDQRAINSENAFELAEHIVSLEYGTDYLQSNTREQKNTKPKKYLYWILYEFLGFSCSQIGARYKRDRTTVIHSVDGFKNHAHLYATERKLNENIKRLL